MANRSAALSESLPGFGEGGKDTRDLVKAPRRVGSVYSPFAIRHSRSCLVRTLVAAIVPALVMPHPALAGEAIDGSRISPAQGLPFVALLVSIALGPVVSPGFWHRHYGKVALVWSIVAVAALSIDAGPAAAASATLEALLTDYLPFVVLIASLYVISGGILILGRIRGRPLANTVILALGAVLASIVGTTGASMILIRPLVRANQHRRHKAHVVVFFIFLVANIGGTLSPVGDPPLFVGFLRGVDFFWTTRNLAPVTAFVALLVLAAFAAIDLHYVRKEKDLRHEEVASGPYLSVRGSLNFALLGAVIGTILVCAAWHPGAAIDVVGVKLPLQDLIRDGVLVLLALLSLWTSDTRYRTENGFDFGPIAEVAKVFAGVFVTIIPVLAMLAARDRGPFAALIELVTAPDGRPIPAAYFWLTGGLSSFLDNVPTYLVFFELAGGDAQLLMGHVAGEEGMRTTLAAISCGAVFMGANSYIGNAPNFMVYAVARQMGVKMPSFLGYLAWSSAVLLPVFGVTTVVFFR
jgi:Na+/H+ antiporter NhaD/arsenite permease-like protein